MSSALDALLEAARYIESQEQHGLRDGWIPPILNSSSNASDHSFRNSNNDANILINNNHNTSITVFNNRHNNHNNARGTEPMDTSNSSSRRNDSFQPHRNNTNGNILNGNGNSNGRILSPTTSPNNRNQNSNSSQPHQTASINIKGFGLNGNVRNQNEVITNGRNSLEDRIENGASRNIEIITNGGRQRHNSSSSPIKNGIQINNNNNIHNNNITANIISGNNSTHAIMSTATEDSSQSSLNLSSSSYLSGSPNNNNNSSSSSALTDLLPFQSSSHISSGGSSIGSRRRTISNTSDGSQSHRNSSSVRPGTREIHNKLEKHRRAHLKECFEQLKVQLQIKDEEKKKTSNLAILGAAYRHVIALRRKERELEQQVELLAKEKINAQKKIVSLKRELVSKYDNIDFSSIVCDPPNGTTVANSTNSVCNVNESMQQQHQAVPLNLNRTSSPQTMLISPNNNNINNNNINNNNNNIVSKIKHNNDVIMTNAPSTKEIISIENNKNIIHTGRKIHRQYSNEKPRDLTINSSHKVVIQTNNGYNGLNTANSIVPTTTTASAISIKEDPDHPTQKIIKQYNLIALAPVDKDNKIISSASLPQVVTAGGGLVIPMISSQALRVIGPNNLSTIEFSTPALQNHLQNSIPSLTSVTSGQQLQKLFINGDCTGTTTISAHPALAVAAAAAAAAASSGNDNKNLIPTSEISRLPGGAELNILPASVGGALYRGGEKLTFVNNAITLKSSNMSGTTAASVASNHNNTSSRTVHVVTSNHQNSAQGLTPIVVTQGQQVNNLTQLIASAPQLNKMNIVAGHHHSSGDTQALINAAQYIHAGSMKQMVVAVANNATPTNNSNGIHATSSAGTIDKI